MRKTGATGKVGQGRAGTTGMSDQDQKYFNEKAIEYADKYKKYKQIENDMLAYNDQLQNQVRKQEADVEALEFQNYKLLEEIQIQEMQIDKQKKVQNQELKEIDGYQQEIEDIQGKIQREDATNKRLD